MELLQLHDGEGEELVAIGDRFGYRVAHPEGFAGTYDFLAGTVTSIFIQSKQEVYRAGVFFFWPESPSEAKILALKPVFPLF